MTSKFECVSISITIGALVVVVLLLTL